MPTERFSNGATSTLAAALTSSVSDTTLVVATADGFPDQPQFRVRVGSELMLVTAVNVDDATFTVERGAEQTDAAAHAPGAAVTQVLTAGALDTLVGSVGLVAPAFLTVSGSPVAGGGTIILDYGDARPVTNGGTGRSNPSDALNALLPDQTDNAGKVLTTTGTIVGWATAGTVTSVNATAGSSSLSVTGGPVTASGTIAIGLSGTALPVANGGTGGTRLRRPGRAWGRRASTRRRSGTAVRRASPSPSRRTGWPRTAR